MIESFRYILDNGLRVVVHTDKSTPVIAVNTLVDAGSKDESPDHTGLAHLFEHLMFSGTEAVPDFDRRLDLAGGQSNAFTNCDITNYYITIPSENIETALWLESDRLNSNNISEEKLTIQKRVVAEEFRQRYLNQPYGDMFLELRKLVYKKHPYRWPAIGLSVDHIEITETRSASEFFKKFYSPENIIIVIAGNITRERAIRLIEKWYSQIPAGTGNKRELPVEPTQKAARREILEREVPYYAITKAWIIDERKYHRFHTFDMITDILAGGESGRLYRRLVRDKQIFTSVNSYITGETERGMLVLTGMIREGVTPEEAEEALNQEINNIMTSPVSETEYQKVKNRYLSSFHISNSGILNRATNLAFFEMLGDSGLINLETENYFGVTPKMIMEVTKEHLTEKRSSTLIYKPLSG